MQLSHIYIETQVNVLGNENNVVFTLAVCGIRLPKNNSDINKLSAIRWVSTDLFGFTLYKKSIAIFNSFDCVSSGTKENRNHMQR